MSGAMMGFIIWAAVGAIIILMGIKDIFSKKAAGFWANVEQFPVNDIKGYNRATGILFILYGIIFIVLGLPLLSGQNSPVILLSVLGVMLETIVLMAIYIIVITKKYRG
ncbi:hypothetical protein [Butyrivibrio sp. XPD2002]|uniref:hypothetical protein n=1 Tax=Butyrivibrio sp. XPD2002 TaxID=1280665 RepID=UPI00047DF282|nr:hypothetical protein [Butyrivibrio sp. XPD2002]